MTLWRSPNRPKSSNHPPGGRIATPCDRFLAWISIRAPGPSRRWRFFSQADGGALSVCAFFLFFLFFLYCDVLLYTLI